MKNPTPAKRRRPARAKARPKGRLRKPQEFQIWSSFWRVVSDVRARFDLATGDVDSERAGTLDYYEARRLATWLTNFADWAEAKDRRCATGGSASRKGTVTRGDG